ncbi:MAG TPA: cytochrome o ubiquinol oxidase subunit III [Candidatus Saccharimonadales bacterium]|nr:cytochrome o ubiquinol oxidase subunit III [Candidatus Saccharimonadales bacterium]
MTKDDVAVLPASAELDREADNKTIFGFWVYLMTDCVLFASLFATYAVLHPNTFGGVSSQDIFSPPFVLAETLILLTSSFTCGLGLLASRRKDTRQTLVFLGITFLLGLAFITMELSEFHHLVSEGNSWRMSGFLSSFFTLVGTHGLHISIGLLWLLVTIFQIVRRGFTEGVARRLTLFTMFWHFLDVVWIFIFTIVYMMGVLVK